MAQTLPYLRFKGIVSSVDGKEGWSELADVGINNCSSTCKAATILDWRAWKEVPQAGHRCRNHLVAIVSSERGVDGVRAHVADRRRQCSGNFALNA